MLKEFTSLFLKHTSPSRRHLTPELVLRLVTPSCPLWSAPVEDSPFTDPFWGFYWPGGQATARYLELYLLFCFLLNTWFVHWYVYIVVKFSKSLEIYSYCIFTKKCVILIICLEEKYVNSMKQFFGLSFNQEIRLSRSLLLIFYVSIS